ncbi:MAG TPA: hypothetical protein VK828_07560 [Terriglobales bacterium]|jgi:hypothetical protein|nr:hypothetical protein [Terriglobales bacterium]
MRRIQFFELHEQAWFPSPLRDGLTDALQFGIRRLRAYAPIVPILERALDATQSRSIVDMCSGGGGPWIDLTCQLEARRAPSPNGQKKVPDLQILLTDKFPNFRAFENVKTASGNRIDFYPASVDAMKVPEELQGLRTMFTSFHHFPPDEARAILQNAVDAGKGIGIFELPRRAPSTILLTFGFVLMLFLGTPWIRPFRWSRLLWTYLIPIVPFALLFDGVVSCLRTYRPEELREMVGGLSGREYRWEMGEALGGGTPITYLVGSPLAPSLNYGRR